MLQMISTGQYSGPERLFFELLQNCEDAPLPANGAVDGLTVFFSLIAPGDKKLASTPASLAGNHGVLIIASNEDGFSSKNVNSICTAAISSKAAQSDKEVDTAGKKTRGFIGEKGVGTSVALSAKTAPTNLPVLFFGLYFAS